MFENFKARAETSGNTEVKRFSTTNEALSFIEEFLIQEEVKDEAGSYAVWADSPILKHFDNETLRNNTNWNIKEINLYADATITSPTAAS